MAVTVDEEARRLVLLATELAHGGRYTEAIVTCGKAVEHSPRFGWAWLCAARCHLELGDLERAGRITQIAADCAGEDPRLVEAVAVMSRQLVDARRRVEREQEQARRRAAFTTSVDRCVGRYNAFARYYRTNPIQYWIQLSNARSSLVQIGADVDRLRARAAAEPSLAGPEVSRVLDELVEGVAEMRARLRRYR